MGVRSIPFIPPPLAGSTHTAQSIKQQHAAAANAQAQHALSQARNQSLTQRAYNLGNSLNPALNVSVLDDTRFYGVPIGTWLLWAGFIGYVPTKAGASSKDNLFELSQLREDREDDWAVFTAANRILSKQE